MARLVIGSTTWTSAGSGGITFELAPEEGLSPVLTHEEFRWPIFLMHVTAAGEAALKTLVDSINAEFDAMSGKSVVYESTDSVPLFSMPSSSWPIVQVEREIDFRGNEAEIAFQIVGRVTPEPGGGGGPPPPTEGALEEIVWQYNLAGNQLAAMVANGRFEPTVGGNTALQNALQWVESIRSGSGRPSFAPAQLRVIEHLIEPIESAAGFAEVRATVMLRETPSAVAGNWPALVQDCAVQVNTVERSVIADVAAGITGSSPSVTPDEPSRQFVVTGQFTLATEGNTTFDGALQKLASGEIKQRGLDAVQSVLTWFESVYAGIGPNLRRSRDTTIEMRLDEGIFSFTQVYESASIVEWSETITKQYDYPYGFSRDFSGRDWVYKPKGGAIATIHREFVVTQLGSTPNPGSLNGGNDWVQISASRDAAVKMRGTNTDGHALLEITVRGSQTYRYANSTGSGMGEGQTSAGAIERTNIAGKDRL